MRNNDNAITRASAIQAMQAALTENNAEGYSTALTQLIDSITNDVRADFQASLDNQDAQILSSRGGRQLTNAERSFYEAFGQAAKSENPSQALTGANLILPETVINAVFEELATAHPLLAEVDFLAVSGNVKVMYSTAAKQGAKWGPLCETISKEIAATFATMDAAANKLTAYVPVCQDIAELGPVWLDRYVRELLAEQIAVGLENAIITGTGKNEPIGMDRNVGPEASVLEGVYPQKDPVTITDLTPKTMGDLVSKLAVDAAGKSRPVSNLVLICNTVDYYKLVMPATTTMDANGEYRKDRLPVATKIIISDAVASGEAIFGMSKRYFMTAGSDKGGRVEYSDEAKFLEDIRLYKIKYHGNGRPKDNNSFLRLNISGLTPLVTVAAPAKAKV